MDTKTNKVTFRKDRHMLLVAFIGLTLFGLLMVYEASSMYAYQTVSDAAYFFKRQLVFFGIGLLLFALILLVDLDFLKRHNKAILLLTLLFLLLVVIIGKRAGGARRWFSIAGVSIQPSELLKISFLLYCADYCRRKKTRLKDIGSGLIPLGLVLGIVCVLVVIQPDLGTAVFWVIWTIIFLYLFQGRFRHLTAVVLCCGAAALILVHVYPYRMRRITSYLDPFADPRGAGYQLIQSQIAYGAGGAWGEGFGESRQKLFFLPAAHTDFLYSIIAEEFGLWGSLGLLGLFFILFHKMFSIARRALDEFRAGILWGILLIFFLEVLINIGVSCGLFPTKGLPLPFLSYGGSSLLVHYMLLGLFFNASKAEEQLNEPRLTPESKVQRR